MKLWVAKNSEVPVHEQLSTQITLAVASGDLAVGDKLPSTQEIARRYEIHPNTIASVYRKLTLQNLLEFRPGSGYYVTNVPVDDLRPSIRVDRMIDELFKTARSSGIAERDVYERLDARRNTIVAGSILLVESDLDLRAILVHEINSEMDLKIAAVSFEDFAREPRFDGIVLTAMFDEKPKIEPLLPQGQTCIYLKGRSVSAAMASESAPPADSMIAVVSAWDGFLALAKVMLLAVRIAPGNLIVRSTKDPDWRLAIGSASIVICDSLTAKGLTQNRDLKVFRLVANESLSELKSALI